MQKATHDFIGALLTAAERRGIKVAVVDAHGGLFSFRWQHRTVMAAGALSTLDSHLGCLIAANKIAIRDWLLLNSLAVPDQAVVLPRESVFDAVETIGYPCVCKPVDCELGAGVTVNIKTDGELIRARRIAQQGADKPVVVQKHVEGGDYRVTVLGGQVVACTLRVPPDPWRPPSPTGEWGQRIDRLATLNPGTAMDCISIARGLGLHAAGIDLITADIRHQGPTYLEVNSGPGLFPHMADTFLDSLFGLGRFGFDRTRGHSAKPVTAD